MQECQNYAGEKEIGEYEFKIFPSEDSDYELYEDDGISCKYKEGFYSITKIESQKTSSLEISVTKPYRKYDSKKKDFAFEIYDMIDPQDVSLSGKSLKRYDNPDFKREGYFFNSKEKSLYVKIKDKDEFILKVK